MISVLNIVTSIHVGGVSTLLLEYLKRSDLSNNRVDILAIDLGAPQLFEDDFKKIGVNVYYMPKSYLKRLFFLFKFLSNRHYDIVHSHIELASAVYLFIAYLCGVKRRIAHAHMAFMDYTSIKNKLLQFVLNNVATDKCGCSVDALISLFGCTDNGFILRNAIDSNLFNFNSDYRKEIRRELGLKTEFVIGYVGRFTTQKNPLRLLDILRETLQLKEDSVLVTVGDGELFDDFVTKTYKLGLEEHVINVGRKKNIYKYMSAFDAFLLPSLYEGLGIVLIEAQAASLQCITTYEYVPKDTNITPYITYVSLDAKDSEWAKKMVSASFLMERRNMVPEIVASGYDINEEAHRLFDFYNNKR